MRTSSFRVRPRAVAVTALIGLLAAATVLPAAVPDLPASAYLAGGVAAALLVLLLVAVGQLTTVVAARRNGLTVDRVELGWLGDPVVRGEPATPGRLARVSASGPLATAAVALAVVGLAVVLEQAIGRSIPAAALGWAGQSALILAAVSLLPVGLMPGNRLLTALLWWRRGDRFAGRAAAARVARALGIAIIVAGAVLTAMFGLVGLWVALAGWLVLGSASAEGRVAKAQAVLRSLRVRDVMADAPDTVPGWLSVQAALDRDPTPRHGMLAVQGFDGRVSGAVPLAVLAAVPADQRSVVRIGTLALPPAATRFAAADDPATSLLHSGPPPAPTVSLVVDGAGQLIGLVTGHDINQAVELSSLRREPADVRR